MHDQEEEQTFINRVSRTGSESTCLTLSRQRQECGSKLGASQVSVVSFQPAREILSQNKQTNKQTKISNTQILLFSLVNSLAQDQENLCFTISPGF